MKDCRCLAEQSDVVVVCVQIVHLDLLSHVSDPRERQSKKRGEVSNCLIQIMNNDTFVYSIVSNERKRKQE
jgi:hypothetical protein